MRFAAFPYWTITGKEAVMAAKTTTKKPAENDIAATYNEFKEFEGRRYTGVKIGRGHKWYYEQGVWKETKITPDEWQIEYAVKKRRAGKAPEGSGVPVGTGYHWYILAHQNVTKLNANDYSTSMTGVKLKLAHKRADQEKWSASPRAQRKHLIKILQEMIKELEQQGDLQTITDPETKTALTRRRKVPARKKVSASRDGQVVKSAVSP
jgi:hypothetical protein